MAAQQGRDLLLKVWNASASPAAYETVGGLRSNSISLNEETVDITTKDSKGARQLLAGGGVQSVSISGSGVFTDSSQEQLLRTKFYAQANSTDGSTDQTAAFTDFQVIVPDLGTFTGEFIITSLEYAGEYNGEATYSVSLESAEYITFAAA